MKRLFSKEADRPPPDSDRLTFWSRSRRRQRWFKTGNSGRRPAWRSPSRFGAHAAGDGTSSRRCRRWRARRFGLRWAFPPRGARLTTAWRRFRLQGIADSQKALPAIYENAGPDVQRLMRYAGLDPDHGLLRWGNFDPTMLLPSTIFEADDTGRSYRLRPCTDAIWLREITIRAAC